MESDNKISDKILSKSKYISGIQCLKYLWYLVNEPDSIPPYDDAALFRFQQGHEVGELAKKLYPEGVEIGHGNDIRAELKIAEMMTGLCSHEKLSGISVSGKSGDKTSAAGRIPLFEPAFSYKNSFARADILAPAEPDLWDIIEVKSSTSLKEINLHDIAFQKYCYEGAGLKINRCFLMYINKDYIKEQNTVDPHKFFILEDVTEKADFLLPDVESNIRIMLDMSSKKSCPRIRISRNCYNPYDCPLKKTCWEFLPKRNVFELYRGKELAFSLYDRGIIEISQINETDILSPAQKIQQMAASQEKVFADRENIRRFLNRLKYPLYFLDFETFATAIPRYNGLKPYQNIPFQYSCNRIQSVNDGCQQNFNFLAENDGTDPREQFLESLRETLGYGCGGMELYDTSAPEQPEGSILVYYESFEKNILRELAGSFTEHAPWIEHAISRITDLYEPFGKFYYYNPAQKGSASLKNVLPALTGISYNDMEISNGQEASVRYLDITFLKDPEDKADKEYIDKIRKDLLDYCGLDTEGMIFILRELYKLVDD